MDPRSILSALMARGSGAPVGADEYQQLLAREQARYHGDRDAAVRSANIAGGFGNSTAQQFMHELAAAPPDAMPMPTSRPDPVMTGAVPVPTPSPTSVPNSPPTMSPTSVPNSPPAVSPTSVPNAPPAISPTSVPLPEAAVSPSSMPVSPPSMGPTVVANAPPTRSPTSEKSGNGKKGRVKKRGQYKLEPSPERFGR
jgi:hypothetical protein